MSTPFHMHRLLASNETLWAIVDVSFGAFLGCWARPLISSGFAFPLTHVDQGYYTGSTVRTNEAEFTFREGLDQFDALFVCKRVAEHDGISACCGKMKVM